MKLWQKIKRIISEPTLVYLLIITFIICACSDKILYSDKICYQVFYNGDLIEDRHYEHGLLKSIVAYSHSDTKDSIIYDGEIKNYHYYNNKYSIDSLFIYGKYYQSDFDQSLQENHIYRIVKNHVLLEDILWSLALIDNASTKSGINSIKKRIITADQSNFSIEYNNLEGQFRLYGLFDTFNTETLQSVKLKITEGFLTEVVLTGDETRKKAIYEYKNGYLYKEKVYSYNIVEKECNYYEEYYYKRITKK